MIQELSEPEVALEEAKGKETPLGPRHLHWVHRDGGGHWLVRGEKRSSLCGTARCREVVIIESFSTSPTGRLRRNEPELQNLTRISPVPQEGYREV